MIHHYTLLYFVIQFYIVIQYHTLLYVVKCYQPVHNYNYTLLYTIIHYYTVFHMVINYHTQFKDDCTLLYIINLSFLHH